MFPTRKPNRLPDYNYSLPGFYYVTICTFDRKPLLSQIENGRMYLLKPGEICLSVWKNLPNRFPDIHLDAFVVMPNHLHGILQIVESELTNSKLGNVIKAYKSLVVNQYRQWYLDYYQIYPNRLWQRSFYDHVIRNKQALDRIREYIIGNPLNWNKDSLYIER